MEWKCNIDHNTNDSSTMKFTVPDNNLSKEELLELAKKYMKQYTKTLIFEENEENIELK